jgi:DnaJ-class molecular chaperone
MKNINYYYNILNIDENTTFEMIKKSFRKLSLQFHPDCNKNTDTTEKYKEIVEAYEYICKNYENCLKNKENVKNKPPPQNNNVFTHDINNIFKIFSNYSNHNINKTNINLLNKPTPIINNTSITLVQSYTGTLIPINIERWIIVDNNKIKERETLYVNIPKGIDNNEIIIIKNKGNVINENNIGDVKIIITILNDTVYKRDGLNLLYYHSISLKEALCGFNFQLISIGGDKLNFENSKTNIITPNKTIKIKNKGMQRETHQGDLIIQFNITFPDNLSIEKINLLQDIL